MVVRQGLGVCPFPARQVLVVQAVARVQQRAQRQREGRPRLGHVHAQHIAEGLGLGRELIRAGLAQSRAVYLRHHRMLRESLAEEPAHQLHRRRRQRLSWRTEFRIGQGGGGRHRGRQPSADGAAHGAGRSERCDTAALRAQKRRGLRALSAHFVLSSAQPHTRQTPGVFLTMLQ